jgi:hypothetical protein
MAGNAGAGGVEVPLAGGGGGAAAVILFEDADVLPEEDRGYLPALASILYASKV